MREILFRGKRKDNGEWVEGYFCRKYFPELPHDRCVIQYKTEYTKEWRPDYMVAEVIPETVGQYTGLTDKNGKKIFDGDIIKHFNHFDEPDKYAVYQVEFDERTCKFVGYLHKSWSAQLCKDLENHYEVIGNIHDNPELLVREQQ